MMRTKAPVCCSPKSPLARQRNLSQELVEKLESTFQVLASATRLRILHALSRNENLSVQEIAERLNMKIAAVSNQLRFMSALGVLGARREGNQIFYFMIDPCVAELLKKGACLAIDAEGRSRG